jgi:L-lactate dehydrogenase complex protein LldG
MVTGAVIPTGGASRRTTLGRLGVAARTDLRMVEVPTRAEPPSEEFSIIPSPAPIGFAMNAREEILDRIRRSSSSKEEPAIVPREYRGPRGLGDCGTFVDRLKDYNAIVTRTSIDELRSRIAESLAQRGIKRIVVPGGFPSLWLGEIAGEVVNDDDVLATLELDSIEGVLTTCTVAIAETGTIILTHGHGEGRRALTLVPDYHLVVVHEGQVVEGVPDAIAALDSNLPMTWISGPSATSDIELRRVEGVHGPRTLEVMLVSALQW